MRHFTEQEIAFVKEQLQNKIPKKRFIQSILHTDCRIFNRMCKEIGIIYPNFKKKRFRNNPFKNVNDPDVQYWLGVLATDGYICNKENNYRCSLSVSEKDIDLLYQYNNFLGGNMTIHQTIHHKKFPIVSINFKNKDVIKFLASLGYNSNKTFDFDPNFALSWDYIRGCFDGDGYFRKNGSYEISIISASEKHILKIKNFIESYGIKMHLRWFQREGYNKIWYLGLHKKVDIDKFINYLYTSAHYFLPRKYELARNIRNNIWKSLKVGEPAEGIPSEALEKRTCNDLTGDP